MATVFVTTASRNSCDVFAKGARSSSSCLPASFSSGEAKPRPTWKPYKRNQNPFFHVLKDAICYLNQKTTVALTLGYVLSIEWMDTVYFLQSQSKAKELYKHPGLGSRFPCFTFQTLTEAGPN